ncbi:MAG: EAL domain-containing protein [Cyanobacteria bacterium J06639_1]
MSPQPLSRETASLLDLGRISPGRGDDLGLEEATPTAREGGAAGVKHTDDPIRKYIEVFSFSPDAVLLSTLTERAIVAVNRGFCRLLAVEEADVLDRTTGELGLWRDPAQHNRLVRGLYRQGAAACQELEICLPNGEVRVGLASAEIVELDSRLFCLTVIRDVSPYQRAIAALRDRQRGLEALHAIETAASDAPSVQVALRRMVEAVSLVLGFPGVAIEHLNAERQVLEFAAARGVDFDDDTPLERAIAGTLAGEALREEYPVARSYSSEAAIPHHEHPLFARLAPRAIACAPMQASRDMLGILSVAHPDDIAIDEALLRDLNLVAKRIATLTQRQQEADRLKHQAFHDTLTDLPNRALFMDRLERLVARAQRRDDCLFAVLFLDLDGFKVINDSLGHEAGDRMLVEVAGRLRSCLRPGDTVSRIGGDEFTFLLDDLNDPSDANRIADRIQAVLSEPISVEAQQVFASASIGIALWSSDYAQSQELVRDADTALYRAKTLGKSRSVVFDPIMHERAVARLQLETELRQAIAEKQLRVYYQPIISFESGRIEGLEALVRWEHPERGLLAPKEFVSVAIETGAIAEIDRWMLRAVCEQIDIWQQQPWDDCVPTVSVNLSAKQLLHPEFLPYLKSVLADTGAEPQYLHVEFVEEALMERADRVTSALQTLQEMGIRSTIDDFGTGFASLQWLHSCPIHRLKIDRSFIHQMDGNALAIVRAIAVLAQQFGLSVTAEGVETAEQMALLRGLGCQSGQGYYFCRPLDRAKIQDFFNSQPQW